MSDLKSKLSTLRIEGERGRRRSGLRVAAWILAVGIASASIFLFARVSATPEVRVAKPTVTKGGTDLSSRSILTASGYLVPRRKAIVSSKIQGRLSELRVEEGSRVEEGEILARLESEDFEAQVARAEASIARARATIARADADLAEYRRQLRKAEELSREGVVAEDDREAAQSRVRIAEAALSQADGELAVATADRSLAQAALDNTVIRAPFAGTVVRKMAEVGESVAPIPPGVNISTASGAIVALADLETLEAEVDVGEANVARLGPAQPASVTVEAFSERKFRAVLRQIIPSADRTKATVLVKVTLLDKDPNLKPEMSARADFLETAAEQEVRASESSIRVPTEALVSGAEGAKVFVVRDGKVQAIPVTAGEEGEGLTVVRSGLEGNESLVLSPSPGLRDGDSVRVR